jgi:hypothetical protein
VANENGGGGFGWGFVLGALAGLVAGAYFASGPGREQVDSLRTRTIELTGRSPELRARARAAAERARGAVSDPDHPVQKAIQDGVQAAKRRRAELEAEAAEAESAESEGTAT